MNSFVNYIIESGISLGSLSLVYFLFLRNETLFKTNRLFLLFTVIFSSVLPLIRMKAYSSGGLFPPEATIAGQANMLDTITVQGSSFSSSLTSLVSANQLLIFTYFIVSGAFALMLTYKIFQLIRMIFRGSVVPKTEIKFVYIKENLSLFSFLNYLFVSKDLEKNPDWEKMLAHESEHIRQGHTMDILMLELIGIFQWFNPFFWLLCRAIKENHEYMADQAVLAEGFTIDQYKKILVTQFIGNQFSMVNNFNSLIKSRLKMMTKIKSSKLASLRYICGGMVAVALFLVFACENKETTIAEQEYLPVPTDDVVYIIGGKIADQDAVTRLDIKSIESIDVLKEGDKTLIEKYGEAVQFGAVIITLKSDSTDASENNIDEVAVVGYDNKSAEVDDPVFFLVDEMPGFPGGELELRKFIANEIHYPEYAVKNGIQGKVYVSFVVEKDGSVGRAKVARGVAPSLDQEALRVVGESPKWTPGKQKGKSVAVSYTAPISFVLQ